MLLLQKMEEYKCSNEDIHPLINQNLIIGKQESYKLNQTENKSIITEQEVILSAEGREIKRGV